VKKKPKGRTKKLDLTKPVERPRMPISIMVRIFIVGSISVGASAYGIYRHYSIPRPSMLMPVPEAGATADPLPPDLLPVPDLIPVPAPSASGSSGSSR
jgi:hypothetical protein